MAEYHQAQADLIIERNATRNFVLNVFDGGFFYLGLSLVSRYTVSVSYTHLDVYKRQASP